MVGSTLVQNITSWAKKPWALVKEKPGQAIPVSVEVKNHLGQDAASVRSKVLDPCRKV